MAATKSQQTQLLVSTADGSSKTISGATAANPVVVTSTSHGLANGSVVFITGVVGMTQLNNRAYVIANQATNTFELKGVDGTVYSAYTSGGAALPKTMTAVGAVTNFTGFDGQAAEIDATDLRSVAKEKLVGIPDYGGCTMTVNNVTDTGQSRLQTAYEQQISVVFEIILSDLRSGAWPAYVQQFTLDVGGPDDKVTGSVRQLIAAAPQRVS